MLVAVDPLLHRIEAMPEHGCYSVSFWLDGDNERSVVMKVVGTEGTDGEVQAPEANLLPGWSPASASFVAVLAAVRAVHDARSGVAGSAALLRDVPGGWDVGVGNVVLDEGHPICVAHGGLELTESATYVCPACGAQAMYGNPS
jgi:hypothetical protein